MNDPYDIRDDLEPGIDADLVALADRLRDARPVPRPGFRGDLGRRLAARDRPHFIAAHVRAAIATYALAGTVLLTIGALGAGGVGPLG
ncbi:MAG: hypothetical protein FWD04_10515 [Conexibacteraceae bacterium]|nr:hypothetical protein [Conexibacteraceae bacterium]